MSQQLFVQSLTLARGHSLTSAGCEQLRFLMQLTAAVRKDDKPLDIAAMLGATSSNNGQIVFDSTKDNIVELYFPASVEGSLDAQLIPQLAARLPRLQVLWMRNHHLSAPDRRFDVSGLLVADSIFTSLRVLQLEAHNSTYSFSGTFRLANLPPTLTSLNLRDNDELRAVGDLTAENAWAASLKLAETHQSFRVALGDAPESATLSFTDFYNLVCDVRSGKLSRADAQMAMGRDPADAASCSAAAASAAPAAENNQVAAELAAARATIDALREENARLKEQLSAALKADAPHPDNKTAGAEPPATAAAAAAASSSSPASPTRDATAAAAPEWLVTLARVAGVTVDAAIVKALLDNEVDGEVIATLTTEDIAALNLSLGARKKMGLIIEVATRAARPDDSMLE